jgi:SAM-dependent methyltransferase
LENPHLPLIMGVMTTSRLIQRINRKLALREPEVWVERYHKARVLARLVATNGMAVHSGPFAGMRYLLRSSWGAILPRLLGCYEEELHEVTEDVIARRTGRVIDVGCAEGYYAIGFARRLPDATVYAFDIDEEARRLCARMAKRNGVARRVKIGGFCAQGGLRGLCVPGTLVLSDCEGFEAELLDPVAVPELRECSMLVETHDWITIGATETLVDRFRGSHHIERIQPRPHSPNRHEVLAGLPEPARRLAVDDQRWFEQTWLYMVPKKD